MSNKWTIQNKLHIWHLLNHILAIIGLIYFFQISINYWWLIISFAMFIISGMVGVNIGLHRYLSHKSFTTGKYRDLFLKYISILSGLGSTVVWVAMHRHHHITSDNVNDIQSPKNIGIVRAWFLNYNSANFPPSLVRDIISCPHNRFIHKYYFYILITLYILTTLLNPLLTIFVLAIPAVLCFHGAAAIGVLPHLFGYKIEGNNDTSYNNILASILSLGEGWHNYHHVNPSDYRHGYKWFEFDPSAHVIHWFLKTNNNK
jgi:stearoyl-CoA desaturase (Delta-9 desaturase)